MTTQQLAAELGAAFEGATRPDGSTYRRLRDGSPEWMTDAIRAAHSNADILPDDWRYAMIEAAADIMAEADDLDDAACTLEPDVYTSELAAWLASNTNRQDYCDQSMQEQGQPSSTFELLQRGQLLEREEVYQQLRQALEALAS